MKPEENDKRRTPVSGDRKPTFTLREASFVPPFDKVTSVSVVAFTAQGDVVATVDKRGADLPGGHVQVGESSPEETARREAKEEAGVLLGKLKFVRAIESDFYGSEPENLTYMMIMTGIVSEFAGDPVEGERLVLGREEFKRRHSALAKPLLSELVDSAHALAFAA